MIYTVGDDPGRLILPLKIETAKATDSFLFGTHVSRFVPARMGAYEYEHGNPEALFAQHANSSKDFHLTEIWAHGACLDTFISAPLRKFNLDEYKVELKRLALGLTSHNRDPGIVGVTKHLAGKEGGHDSDFKIWFDMDRGVMFTFDLESARHIVVGPAARLNRFPVPVEDSVQAA